MNERSLEAFSTAVMTAESQRELILDEFFQLGRTGTFGEKIIRKIGGPAFDKTGFARLSELKGISLGHSVALIRTGETQQTAQKKNADVLIHIAHADDGQIQAHIEWVESQHRKREENHKKWTEKHALYPHPTLDVAASARKG